MATEKQLSANLQNAQKSAGPVTAEGKFISSHNAVKTGLTGQTVLLKTDDATAYQAHLQRFNEKFTPASDDDAPSFRTSPTPNGVSSASSRSKPASSP